MMMVNFQLERKLNIEYLKNNFLIAYPDLLKKQVGFLKYKSIHFRYKARNLFHPELEI